MKRTSPERINGLQKAEAPTKKSRVEQGKGTESKTKEPQDLIISTSLTERTADSTESAPIYILNDDILLAIFSYFSTAQILQLRSVCKAWLQWIMSHQVELICLRILPVRLVVGSFEETKLKFLLENSFRMKFRINSIFDAESLTNFIDLKKPSLDRIQTTCVLTVKELADPNNKKFQLALNDCYHSKIKIDIKTAKQTVELIKLLNSLEFENEEARQAFMRRVQANCVLKVEELVKSDNPEVEFIRTCNFKLKLYVTNDAEIELFSEFICDPDNENYLGRIEGLVSIQEITAVNINKIKDLFEKLKLKDKELTSFKEIQLDRLREPLTFPSLSNLKVISCNQIANRFISKNSDLVFDGLPRLKTIKIAGAGKIKISNLPALNEVVISRIDSKSELDLDFETLPKLKELRIKAMVNSAFMVPEFTSLEVLRLGMLLKNSMISVMKNENLRKVTVKCLDNALLDLELLPNLKELRVAKKFWKPQTPLTINGNNMFDESMFLDVEEVN